MNIPGEALATKMWETLTEKGIGSLLKPWSIRREGQAIADARRSEMLSLAQTQLDVESIQRGEKQLDKNGYLISIQSPNQSSTECSNVKQENPLLYTALENNKYRHAVDVLSDEVTLARIALYAEEELLEGGQDSIEGEVSEDWLRRWRESTKGISSENLQQLWGKILAGEFRNPGKYSLRTLEFLRNLSQEEANAIAKFGPYVINIFGIIYAEPISLLEKKGIENRNIFELLDLGILIYAEPKNYLITSTNPKSYINVVQIGNRVIRFTSDIQSRELSISAWCLTKLGKEIFELGKFDIDEEYFLHVANGIKNKGFKTQIGTWLPGNGSEIFLIDLVQI